MTTNEDETPEEVTPRKEYFYFQKKPNEFSIFWRDVDSKGDSLARAVKSVESYGAAMELIDLLKKADIDGQQEALRKHKEYLETLKVPHRFNRNSLDSILCDCGTDAHNDIHLVPNSQHLYTPQDPEAMQRGHHSLCKCGRTKNDPRHLEESEM